MNYISIGPTPCDESCIQVGSGDYYSKMRKESYIFKRMIERIFSPPNIVSIRVKSFSHEAGPYCEVVCQYFDDTGEDFALKLEKEVPTHWDEQALNELKESGLLGENNVGSES